MRRLAALVCVTALAVAGCAQDQDSPGGGTDRGLEDTDDLERTETPQPVDAGADDEPYQCAQVSWAGTETTYTVGEGGTATLVLDGDSLSVTEVEANEGWDDEVVTEEGTEVEVRFTSDADDVALRAVLGDPQANDQEAVVAEICTRVD